MEQSATSLERSGDAERAFWSEMARAYKPPGGHGFVRISSALLRRDVLDLLMPRGGEEILDAACGTGLLTRDLAARGARVWAVDFSPQMLGFVEGAEQKICADLKTLDLGRTFDAITCIGALNFIDADAVLPRLAAHLRPGGILVVSITRGSLIGLVYRAVRIINRTAGFRWVKPAELKEAGRAAGLRVVGRKRALPHDTLLAFQRV